MSSLLVVATPATDLHLLTIAELRAAVGVTGAGEDAALLAMSLKICAAITTECQVAVGRGGPPTLKRETLSETHRCVNTDRLLLSRRHDAEITSIVNDGNTLDSADFEVDPESGVVTKLSNDAPTSWCASKVTVVYQAGFVTIPDDLKMAAADFFRLAWIEHQRDPALKSLVEDIPGVRRVERTWWVGSVPGQSKEGAVPDVVAGQLARFRNVRI